MRLTVHRIKDNGLRTMGVISIDGRLYGWTLEDPWADNRKNISCIPAGEFGIRLTYSPKFKIITPELVGVPNRTHIRIHPGNEESDTEGCILVGSWVPPSMSKLYDSNDAFGHLMGGLRHGKPDDITILVINSHKGE